MERSSSPPRALNSASLTLKLRMVRKCVCVNVYKVNVATESVIQVCVRQCQTDKVIIKSPYVLNFLHSSFNKAFTCRARSIALE